MEHQPLTASYWRSAWRWLAGFGRLGDVPLKPGWRNGPLWWAVYAVDYGAACVFLGIGVQPISRWAGERMQKPWTWLADILNRLQPGHTSAAGPLLWGTQPCPRQVRYVVMGLWAAVLIALICGFLLSGPRFPPQKLRPYISPYMAAADARTGRLRN